MPLPPGPVSVSRRGARIREQVLQLGELPAAADQRRRRPGKARPRTARARRERRLLAQDRRLQLPQLRRRLDPELAAEQPPGVAVDAEGVGLASGAIQRQHQLRAQPLSQRVGRDERLELADELGVAPEREARPRSASSCAASRSSSSCAIACCANGSN